MSAPLGRLCAPWVDLPLFGLLLACAPVCALSDLPEQVGLGLVGGASLFERAALSQVLGFAQVQQLGAVVEDLCATDVMVNYGSRADLKATVTKALEHCIKTSQGMHENLHDLVYDALSEEWARRDGEISDPWEDEPAGGYQPPSYEPVNPERRSPQTPSGALI